MESTGDVDLQAQLGRRVKAARALSGKKVRELAHELGWSDEKVYRLERGDQIPDAVELSEIAAVTGQSVEFFYEGITSQAAEAAVLTDHEGQVKRGDAA